MPTEKHIALIGAGYIADWHIGALKATPGVTLTAICDRSASAAEALAGRYGLAHFTSLEALVAARVCDTVHILTPPDSHHALALDAMAAGLDVVVEKPVALSAAQTHELAEAAKTAGRRLQVGHNFLGLPRYEALKARVAAGDLGRISGVEITWALPLSPLRSGPYGLWLMRQTQNLLLELGPHPFSFAIDLFGPLEILACQTGQEIPLPGGATRPQSWRILARAGAVDVTISLSLVETMDLRQVRLRGSSGQALLDYAADTLVVSRDNTSDLVVNPLRKSLSQAWGHLREGVRNGAVQASSLNRKSPYAQSFRGMTRALYADTQDARFSIDSAAQVMQAIDDTLALLPEAPRAAPAQVTARPDPSVMVIGGTGYIGRNLTRALVARGRQVRVLSRGAHGPFPDLAGQVETRAASLSDPEALTQAMEGIETVYNLAKSTDTTWQAALQNDVATTARIGEAALAAGVGRLIYTGTIASYDMSDPAQVITEATDFGDLRARNIYARAKAEGEARLRDMAQSRGLPLSIARPGIVIGGDGPLQHWGIGRWHGPGAVKLWGAGRNILPFVLADDLSDALIAMAERDDALGQSFNLVGTPMLTGRDYFDAIHTRLGARLRVSGGNLTAMWAMGAVKQGLKRRLFGQRDAMNPSRADWLSRGHFAQFDNSAARTKLNWTPETDPDAFLTRALDRRALFGV